MLAEELRRRIRKIDRRHPLTERREIVGNFQQKLTNSGYNLKTREEIMKYAVKKQCREL